MHIRRTAVFMVISTFFYCAAASFARTGNWLYDLLLATVLLCTRWIEESLMLIPRCVMARERRDDMLSGERNYFVGCIDSPDKFAERDVFVGDRD